MRSKCCHLIWKLIFLFSVLCLAFYLFLVLIFLLFCWCLLPFPAFAAKLRFSVTAFILLVSFRIIDVSSKSGILLYFWSGSTEQCILSDDSRLLYLLHSTTILSRFTNSCSKEWITSSLFFNCSLRNVMSFCNCFIERFEFSIKKSLIQCLFLKKLTSAKNDSFSASNSFNYRIFRFWQVFINIYS